MVWSGNKAPEQSTEDGQALALWVEDELERFANDQLDNLIALDLRPIYAAPLRPRQGMIVYADGTKWDPGLGEGGYILNAAGVWVRIGSDKSFGAVRSQRFVASGTYTPDANLLYAVIEGLGGGGGGGGSTGSLNQAYAGAGGGSGSYARLITTLATIGASKAVVIGTGGAGGATGNNAGSAGVDTTFGGTLLVAKGGSGGGFTSAAAIGGPGAGGVVGTGTITFAGCPGLRGSYINNATVTNWLNAGGFGGAIPPWGYPGTGGATNIAGSVNGATGVGFGSGGGGGISLNTVTTGAGGDGALGIILITEFCSK